MNGARDGQGSLLLRFYHILDKSGPVAGDILIRVLILVIGDEACTDTNVCRQVINPGEREWGGPSVKKNRLLFSRGVICYGEGVCRTRTKAAA